MWNPERVPHLLRSLRLAKPAFARAVEVSHEDASIRRPIAGQTELVAHHYFLVRYAVYKVETEVQ